jgi:glycerate 2-kinase
MKILNADMIATTALRRDALAIAEAGLEAIDTTAVIRELVRKMDDTLMVAGESFSRKTLGRIIVIAVGKCAIDASRALEDILGDDIDAGISLDVRPAPHFRRLSGFEGTHPEPSDANVKAAASILDRLAGLDERDLVIFVISGGGSTLLCLPEDGGCTEEAAILQALTKSAAPIQEINTVRKHLSRARGGFFAKAAYPARVIALIFSDVPGNDLQFIASGPTVKDDTSVADAEKVLTKYDVLRMCDLDNCGLVETPKEEKYFANVTNVLAVSNTLALDAMRTKAETLGFSARIVSDRVTGEAREVAGTMGRDIARSVGPTALLWGGEMTVTVRGNGRGGRNLELALAATKDIRDNALVMSIASDGHDNATRFAGAIADASPRARADASGLSIDDYLARNDSYSFYERTGQYLSTGDTGSNVSDLLIALSAAK